MFKGAFLFPRTRAVGGFDESQRFQRALPAHVGYLANGIISLDIYLINSKLSLALPLPRLCVSLLLGS